MSKVAEIKTKPSKSSVKDFIQAIPELQKRNDCMQILEMMQKHSGEQPVIWGSSIIGFGLKRYKSPATGREVDWLRIGFAPRKTNVSIYFCSGLDRYDKELLKLGKHKRGVGCLYVQRLSDIDLSILEGMIVSECR